MKDLPIPLNQSSVRDASAVEGDDLSLLAPGSASRPSNTPAPLNAIDEARQELRRGKHLLALDDSPRSLEFVLRTLSAHFPGRIRCETDSEKGKQLIREMVAAGKLDALILAVDNPSLSGRALLVELASEGIFVPTIFLSGGWCDRGSGTLCSQICAAGNMEALHKSVEERLVHMDGIPITILPRTLAEPEYLMAAVDAMLLAGRLHAPDHTPDSASLQAALALPKSFARRLADEFMAFFEAYRLFADQFKEAALRLGEDPKATADFNKQWINFTHFRLPMADSYTYTALTEIDDHELQYLWDELRGARGLVSAFRDMQTMVNISKGTPAFDEVKTIEKSVVDYVEAFQARVSEAHKLRREAEAAG